MHGPILEKLRLVKRAMVLTLAGRVLIVFGDVLLASSGPFSRRRASRGLAFSAPDRRHPQSAGPEVQDRVRTAATLKVSKLPGDG